MITNKERKELQDVLKVGFKYIAQDESGNLWAYAAMPKLSRGGSVWTPDKERSEWTYKDFKYLVEPYKSLTILKTVPRLISDILNEDEAETPPKGIVIDYEELPDGRIRIVTASALAREQLPKEYIASYPVVIGNEQGLWIESRTNIYLMDAGSFYSPQRFKEIIEICEAAGKRLGEINRKPKRIII